MFPLVNKIKIVLQQLRWKLALSYMAVTVGTLLVAVLLATVLLFRVFFAPNEALTREVWLEAANRNMIPALRHVLSQTPPDTEMLQMMLQDADATITSGDLFRLGDIQFSMRTIANFDTLIVAADGSVLATSSESFAPMAKILQPLDEQAVAGMSNAMRTALLAEDGPLQMALRGEEEPERLFAIMEPNERFLFAVPVFGAGEDRARVLGAIVANIVSLPTEDDITSHALLAAGRSLLLFLLGAGILAALFGSLTAGNMVKRFKRLSLAANAWSQGEFSGFIVDTTGDELSELAQRLNVMAEQLQTLLTKRQEMAVAEERNRLARDLHDSAKQQAFAASAQIAAAVALNEREPQAAKPHLLEAAKLVDKVRKELTSLILELRPVDLSQGGLADALRKYAVDWAHQNGIKVGIQIEGERPLPLEVEETLFRICQEALANTARHSQAKCAEVWLVYDKEAVMMTISDDGRGFDAGAVHDGLGLHSMRERAGLIDGTLVVKSSVGRGTQVSVTCEGWLSTDT